jgi:hypothetical protein
MRRAAADHGNPTIVIASTKAPTSQAMPAANPPKTNHKMFRTKVKTVPPRRLVTFLTPTCV